MKTHKSSKFVSVIIPIYNAEKYLRVCLDSILNQTYQKIEVVLVDDKSKDGSLKIAKEYVKNDKRIKLVSKDVNQGINQARKTGFENAIGDYIMFVDDDDVIVASLIEDHLSALFKADADISISKAFWWNENDALDIERIYRQGNGDTKVLHNKLAYRSLITETSPFSDTEVGMLWNKLYKRSYFEGYDWSLSNMPAEDFMTNARLLANVESVVYINQVHYFHRVSSTSTMGRLSRKKGANTKQAIDIFDALSKVSEVFQSIAEDNGWNFEKEIIYFKYRYFYIRMEAFLAGNSLTEEDYQKVKRYSSKNELETLLSDDFCRYISEYVYYPANIILPTLVKYWHDFAESEDIAEFLERRANALMEELHQRDAHIRHIESSMLQSEQLLHSIQSLSGSLFNFLGKVKRRIILRALHAPKALVRRYKIKKLEKKYENCWIVMDRVENASDNGYAFYSYLLENHPEVNAYFAINESSKDVPKLQKQGFRLVFIGTEEHCVAVKESSKLFYAYFTFEYSNETAQRIFLGHGITKDDLPNPGVRPSDYFITTLDQEQEFLSERVDMTPVKIGQPRYEKLVHKVDGYTGKKDKVVIAPTWRPWLYLESETNKNDEYFVNWQKLLSSDELKELSDKNDIIFILHPMMVELEKKNNVDYFQIPEYIKSTSYDLLGLDNLQDLLVQTKLLVTDYSSIAFDATIAGASVVYFQFDEDTFRTKGQLKQGWFEYKKDGFGPVCGRYKDLGQFVRGRVVVKEVYQKRAQRLRDSIRKTEGVSDALFKLTKRS